MLPTLPYGDGIRKETLMAFGGYNHVSAAGNGEIYDMHHMTGDELPLLCSRRPRYRVRQAGPGITGVTVNNGIFYTNGTGFHAWDGDGEFTSCPGVDEREKRFGSLGKYVVILPDKKYYDREAKELGDIEAEAVRSCRFIDGSYAGVSAKGNTIQTTGSPFPFRVGDAVTISGGSEKSNNKTAVIREMSDDKMSLRFYENTFTNDSTMRLLTLRREMPDMDFVCEHENRLWGCRGSTIYCCKLGDIFNWNVFDNISTSSYAADVGSAGDFTGCFAYQGHVLFFKEKHIYRVYGNKPSNFQVVMSAEEGVMKGSDLSPAVAGEQLFYLSNAGVMAYSGGVPVNISAPLGLRTYRDAVGGSDGTKYYISMQDEDGESTLFIYDTRHGLWFVEKDRPVRGFGWNGTFTFCDGAGDIWCDRGEVSETEGAVSSMVEFGDFTYGGSNRQGISKLQIRMEVDTGAKAEVSVMFDSSGIFEHVRTVRGDVTGGRKGSHYLPVIPRRCDHFRVKIECDGPWKLHSLAQEVYTGSEMF